MDSNLWTVCFEGLHRTGKGTQIKLLRDYLDQNQQRCLILKGDGSRDSVPLPNSYNQEDSWWGEWKLKTEVTEDDWDEAFRRLQIENEGLYSDFGRSGDKGFVLMDRGPISRYFTEKRRGENPSLEEIVGKISPSIDKSLVLEVPKKRIIAGIKYGREAHTPASQYRMQFIEENFNLWQEVLDEAKNFFGDTLVRLTAGRKTPDTVHQMILNSYKM